MGLRTNIICYWNSASLSKAVTMIQMFTTTSGNTGHRIVMIRHRDVFSFVVFVNCCFLYFVMNMVRPEMSNCVRDSQLNVQCTCASWTRNGANCINCVRLVGHWEGCAFHGWICTAGRNCHEKILEFPIGLFLPHSMHLINFILGAKFAGILVILVFLLSMQ